MATTHCTIKVCGLRDWFADWYDTPILSTVNRKINSLGFDRSPADTRVVVAMSGGVDSSVTAALLHEQGFDVVGVTLQLYDHGAATGRAKACCAGQDIYDAHRVADMMGFPHYVLDYESRFREDVIEDFADAYVRGETPIPCVTCNQTVKFRDLMETARDLGADALATGHYIRRETGPFGAELHRAVDTSRDQSYFLFATTREQLDYLRFPLGAIPKDQVREHARRLGLSIAEKPDSQDICFVPDGKYSQIVEKLRPGAAEPGDIIHLNGTVLGRHHGILNFTVGQRRGLGVGGRKEAEDDVLYVVRLDPDARQVIVGPRAALATSRIQLNAVNWLGDGGGLPLEGMAMSVKVRSAMDPVLGRIAVGRDGTAVVELEMPEFGVSPGQAAVFYDGDRVLGGGWIRRSD
ncbi:MAG TPA: tRNA 2-thiouridine(34) synthase MnmA [Rhodospirillaceae bacterium]|nr:tRNA 2-thiouridine(34) synthase MnmA [Rhodospirillaceae bacterium]